jgi:uncharacterized protein (DUF1330 family)
MAKGYVIARANVTDPDKWATYAAQAKTVLDKFGGKVLVRGGKCEVLDGDVRSRNVVYEFESYEQAHAYLFSPEYATARKLREGAGQIDLICVEGV